MLDHTFVPTNTSETSSMLTIAHANTTMNVAPPGKLLITRVATPSLDCHTNSASASCAATNSAPVKTIVSVIWPSIPRPSTEMSGGSHQVCVTNSAAEMSVMTVTATANNLPTVLW